MKIDSISIKSSKLRKIGKFAFSFSSFESLTIPSCIEKFEIGWYNELLNLKNISIIPYKEKNICYYDNKFILGKSDLKSDVYDNLCFVKSDIKYAFIPSFIKIIAPFSFNNCRKLEKIEFDVDSQLELIDDHAFESSNIKCLEIPSNVKKIGLRAFPNTINLKKFVISDNSKLKSIGELAFLGCGIESFWIPQNVTSVGNRAFCPCKKLQIIQFPNNFDLLSVKNAMIKYDGIILIPFK